MSRNFIFTLTIALSLLTASTLKLKAISKNEARQAKAEAQAFLDENKQREEIATTRSGLQYEVLHKSGSEQLSRSKDVIEIHYHGTLVDGTVFDSSLMRGEPIDVRLWEVIPGWAEGLKLMSPGDKYRFYIPSNLAYGSKGNGAVPGHAVLIVEIELVALKEKIRPNRKKN